MKYVFAIPLCGSSRNVQEIECRIPGMISGTTDAAYISALPGTSVRTSKYASAVPTTNANTVDPNENTNELSSIVPSPTALYAVRNAETVKWPSRTNVCQSR